MEYMMTLSNGNISRVIVPLRGESFGHQWIPLTNTSDVELSCLLWSAPDVKPNNRDAGDLWRHRAHDVTVMREDVEGYRAWLEPVDGVMKLYSAYGE